MEIILVMIGLILTCSIVTFPMRLIFKKWKDSTVGYISAFILSISVLIISREPIDPFSPIRVLTGTLIFGSLIWGVLALIRRLRRGFTKQSDKSTTTKDYVICRKCGLEQWNGYQVCQKCHTLLQAKK